MRKRFGSVSFILLLSIFFAGFVLAGEYDMPMPVAETTLATIGKDQTLDGADQQEMLARIIPIIKSRIAVDDSLSEFNSSVYQSDQPRFVLSWSTHQGRLMSSDSRYVSVEADMFGNLFYYSNSQSKGMYADSFNDGAARLHVLSERQGLLLAIKFIAKACPDVMGQISLAPLQGAMETLSTTNSSFFFNRMLDGHPVFGEGIRVDVNMEDGYISWMSRTWTTLDETSITPAYKAMSQEDAVLTFGKNSNLKLVYAYDNAWESQLWASRQGEPRPVVLTYTLMDHWLQDAVSGETLPWLLQGEGVVRSNFASYMDQYNVHSAKELTLPEEKAVLDDMDTFQSREELYAHAWGIAHKWALLGDEAVLDSISYGKYNKDVYAFLCTWAIPVSARLQEEYGLSPADAIRAGDQVSVVLNAKTGELLSYQFGFGWIGSNAELKDSEELTREERLASATEFMQAERPDLLAQARYQDIPVLAGIEPLLNIGTVNWVDSSMFTWIRQEQGLDFVDNGFTVSVDARTGGVTMFRQVWEDVTFPTTENVVSLAEAERALFAVAPLELGYALQQSYTEDGTMLGKPSLVYYGRLLSSLVVAADGTVKITNGAAYRDLNKDVFQDIANHPAKSKIETLARYGMLSLTSLAFNPNATITEQDYVLILARMGMGYAPYLDIENTYMFASNHVLDGDYQPEAELTHGKALTYLLRTVGYYDIAEMQGIFPADIGIPTSLAGYASIGSSLKLMNTATWKPNAIMTRAEMAELLYAYMARPYVH